MIRAMFLWVIVISIACSPQKAPDPPEAEDLRTNCQQTGTYNLEGSTCRVFEVYQLPKNCPGCGWFTAQRFSLCDPPLPGFVGGSLPRQGKYPGAP